MTRIVALSVVLAACGGSQTKPVSKAAPGKLDVSVALMLPVGDGLVPVACWDAAQKKVRGGEGCLDLVTPGTAVRYDDGASAQVTGQAPTNAAACGVDRVASVSGGEGAAFAVWPDSATLGIQRVGEGRTPEPAEKQALQALAHASAPDAKQEVVILQAVELDLGEAKPVRLYSVSQDATDTTPGRFAFSALIAADDAGQLHVLESSRAKAWKVEATLDLDHNGKREVWLTTELYDQDKQSGTGNVVGRVEGGKLDVIGELSCAAQ
jgi:hypothetical protein